MSGKSKEVSNLYSLCLIGWRVRNTITPATVGSQCCGAISVLGEEIGPHNATAPGTTLAEDLRAHPVPFVCPGLPMFAW